MASAVPTNNHPPPMMHPSGSDYPHELSSFLHTHPLAHMIRNPHVPSRTHRICDVCRESIHENFYSCNHCHFHVHPLCTRLPQHLRHVIDDHHKLSLHKLSSGRCSLCKADCSSIWVYGCDICKFNIHLKCLTKPCAGSRGVHHHAPPPVPQFHGGFPGGGGYPHGYYHFGHHGVPVQFAPPSSSSLGSVFGSTMFSLVEKLAIGAFSDFLFGSVSF